MPHDRKNNNKMQCLILTPISLAPGSPLGTPFRRLSPAPALVESFFGLSLIHRTAGRQSRESGFIRPSLLGAPPTPALAVKQIGSPAGGSLVKGKNLNPASALLLARIAPGGRSPQTPARAAYYIPFSAAHVKCMGRIRQNRETPLQIPRPPTKIFFVPTRDQ